MTVLKHTASKLAFATLVAASMTAPAFAQSADPENLVLALSTSEDVGASERINFSGKLRMLSQRIPAAACNLAAGIAADDAKTLLSGAATEFEKIAKALRVGNSEMNINGAETRRKTLVALDDLDAKWVPVRAAVDALMENGNDADALAQAMATNMPLLESAKLLVSELSGEYADPTAMLQADALLVDISGRQRMLTQKMSKEVCQIASGDSSDDRKKALAGTVSMFDVSLIALRDGMPAAGIKAAPTAEIKAGLDEIAADWAPIKAELDLILTGTEISRDQRAALFASLNKTMAKMNAVVSLYDAYAKENA